MKKPWDRAAMRFAAASYADCEGMLDVRFENGDHVLIAAESVVAAASPLPSPGAGSRVVSAPVPVGRPDWDKMRIGETGDVLEVPGNGAVIEIPWDRIRA